MGAITDDVKLYFKPITKLFNKPTVEISITKKKSTTRLELVVPSNYWKFPRKFIQMFQLLIYNGPLIHNHGWWKCIKWAWQVALLNVKGKTFNAEAYTKFLQLEADMERSMPEHFLTAKLVAEQSIEQNNR